MASDERTERRDADAGAEEVGEPGMPGPRTPSAKPWSATGSVGRGKIVLSGLLPPKIQPLSCPAWRGERVAAVEADAERARALQLEVHDDRLDEDLAPRLIEAVDDVAQRRVVALSDEVMTIELVALSALTFTPPSKMPLAGRRRLHGSRRRARRAARSAQPPTRRTAPVMISLSVFVRSTASACWSGEDVDLALARLRHVDPLDDLEHPQVRALGRHDDQRVRAIVGDDLRDVEVARRRAPPAARSTCRLVARRPWSSAATSSRRP